MLWTSVPWLLLDRRIPWRRLLPAGALTATGASLYGVATTIYMPRLMETNSERYGLFGVTVALVGWLLCISFIVVAATVVAAEFDRSPEPWARAVRRRLGIRDAETTVSTRRGSPDGPRHHPRTARSTGRGGLMTQQAPTPVGAAAAASGLVLLTLASAQFLMTLDSSVMNVSIATVAEDLGTTVTGIQTAITLYTLVMASLMITGGKIGQILGRKRAFAIGCVIYGGGSFITSLAPNLTVLLIGWSLLEGIGAALIMPAIVALVASNFAPRDRPRAYGLVASAGAIAVAAGPLIGGLLTTYASWRWVFAGEVVVVLGHPGPGPADGRRARRPGARPRPRRHRAVGARPRAGRLRHPPRPAPGASSSPSRAPRVAGPLAGRLAGPGRRRRAARLPRLGAPPAASGARRR